MNTTKEERLRGLQEKIAEVGKAIGIEEEKVRPLAERPDGELNKMRKEDREYGKYLRLKSQERMEDFRRLRSSPMFAKFVYRSITEREGKTIYISKQKFMEEGIYSWTAPIATIRFESPGPASYRLPNGQAREVKIAEKEQYMIVGGKVMFFAREEIGKERELIHQEHFSIKKGAFMLPEIVELMEKAQDAVIRASHVGPFLISGPAGSGKTTLALHRVAYLAQAPESAAIFAPESILVLVQDSSTKEYFSRLLPELGIHDVAITTFFEWASGILKLNEEGSDVTYVSSTGSAFEFEKLKIKNEVTKDPSLISQGRGEAFSSLSVLYSRLGSSGLAASFGKQKQSRTLDRIDITLALMMFMRKNGRLELSREYNRAMRGGRIIRKKEINPLTYSLIIVDEFQNYMPEQLSLLRSCVNEDTKSMIYVGDMAQQIQHGTIRGWDDIGETVAPDRQIMLQKVYRNTQEILSYVKSLGFPVSIPEKLKRGPEVIEKVFSGDLQKETCAYVEEILKSNPERSVGVIGIEGSDVEYIKQYFVKASALAEKLRISTVMEAQGVEFDVVCIVGIGDSTLKAAASAGMEFEEESRKIKRDLMYIALTRSMSDMHVIGSKSLTDLMSNDVLPRKAIVDTL